MGKFLCGQKFSDQLDKYLGTQLLDHMVRLWLALSRITNLFSRETVQLAFLPAVNASSHCSSSFLTFDIISFLDFIHTNKYIEISHCLNWPFP